MRGVASICCCHRVRVQWVDTTAALWVSMLVLFPFESSRLGSLWLTFFVHRTIFFYLSYGEFLSGGPSLYDQTSPVIFIPPPLPRMFVIISSLFRPYFVIISSMGTMFDAAALFPTSRCTKGRHSFFWRKVLSYVRIWATSFAFRLLDELYSPAS